MAASDGCLCLSQYRSEFVCTLEPLVRARYETKVLLCGRVNPYCLRKDDFSTNFEYLPKLQFPDISNYFVLQVQTSFYTKNEMKAFKSMDAYIFFFVCGWVHDLRWKQIQDNTHHIFTRMSKLMNMIFKKLSLKLQMYKLQQNRKRFELVKMLHALVLTL